MSSRTHVRDIRRAVEGLGWRLGTAIAQGGWEALLGRIRASHGKLGNEKSLPGGRPFRLVVRLALQAQALAVLVHLPLEHR